MNPDTAATGVAPRYGAYADRNPAMVYEYPGLAYSDAEHIAEPEPTLYHSHLGPIGAVILAATALIVAVIGYVTIDAGIGAYRSHLDSELPPTTVAAAPPVAAPTLPAPPPDVQPKQSPATPDDAFLNDLVAAGITPTNVENTIGNGHEVCTLLKEGIEPVQIANLLRKANPTLTLSEANANITIAVKHYCPGH